MMWSVLIMKHQNINEGADVVYALGHEIAEKYRRASVILHVLVQLYH